MANLQGQLYFALQNINLSNDTEKRDAVYSRISGEEKENTTKKDFKEMGVSSGYIFSFSSMQNICSISKDFANFCKEQGINKANKIKPQIARQFLEYKQSMGLSDRTLKTYKMALEKINIAIVDTYNCKGFCRGDDNIKNFHIATPQTIERRLTNTQVEQIIENARKYKDVYKVSSMLGLRCDEIKHLRASDFNFGNGAVVEHIKQGRIDTTDTVHICKGTKGGLDRYVKIRAEDKEYLQRVFSVEKPFAWVERTTENKNIKSIAEKLGFGKVGSSHEFRKYWASTEYARRIDDTMTRSEKKEIAREIVSMLGHGRARDDLIKIYIGRL